MKMWPVPELEYAYDDWCIMKLAQQLNRPRKSTFIGKESKTIGSFLIKREQTDARKNEDGNTSPFSP